MDRSTHLATWDMMRLRHGIALRLVDQFTDAQITSHPVAGMRTPAEILVHVYAFMDAMADSPRTGKLDANSTDEPKFAASVTTKAQLLAFMNERWTAADRAARALTDADLGRMVETPWGNFPGAAMLGFIYDEFLHHRGQIYAFARVYGMEPVMVWDFDHSAPQFQPQAAATS
jgi:uncharacterized damage-inducible protein DinB